MRYGYFGARRVGGAEREHSDPKSQVKKRGHYYYIYYIAELRSCVKVDGFQARSKDQEILEEGGGAGPSLLPRRDHE